MMSTSVEANPEVAGSEGSRRGGDDTHQQRQLLPEVSSGLAATHEHLILRKLFNIAWLTLNVIFPVSSLCIGKELSTDYGKWMKLVNLQVGVS